MKKIILIASLLLCKVTFSQNAYTLPAIIKYHHYNGNHSDYLIMLNDLGFSDTTNSMWISSSLPAIIDVFGIARPDDWCVFSLAQLYNLDSITFYSTYTPTINRLDPYWMSQKAFYMTVSIALDSVTAMKTLIATKAPKNGTSSQYIKGDGTFGTYSTGGEVIYNNGSLVSSPKNYTGSSTATTGVATFYLTTNGLSSGTAIFTNVNDILSIVNDATTNYTYGWSISTDKKTLTVTSKYSPGLVVGLLTLLGVPVNVPNGTSVSVLVKGN